MTSARKNLTSYYMEKTKGLPLSFHSSNSNSTAKSDMDDPILTQLSKNDSMVSSNGSQLHQPSGNEAYFDAKHGGAPAKDPDDEYIRCSLGLTDFDSLSDTDNEAGSPILRSKKRKTDGSDLPPPVSKLLRFEGSFKPIGSASLQRDSSRPASAMSGASAPAQSKLCSLATSSLKQGSALGGSSKGFGSSRPYGPSKVDMAGPGSSKSTSLKHGPLNDSRLTAGGAKSKTIVLSSMDKEADEVKKLVSADKKLNEALILQDIDHSTSEISKAKLRAEKLVKTRLECTLDFYKQTDAVVESSKERVDLALKRKDELMENMIKEIRTKKQEIQNLMLMGHAEISSLRVFMEEQVEAELNHLDDLRTTYELHTEQISDEIREIEKRVADYKRRVEMSKRELRRSDAHIGEFVDTFFKKD